MAIALLLLSLLMVVVGLGSLAVSRRQLREARRLHSDARSADRINRAVTSYLQLYNGHQDSELSALVESDISGMSSSELDEVVERIAAATGKDPLGEGHTEGGIRAFLSQHQIAVADFIDYVTKHRVRPRDLNYEKLQQIAIDLKNKGN